MHLFKDEEGRSGRVRENPDFATLVNFSMYLPVFYCLDQSLCFDLGRKRKRGGVGAGLMAA